MSDLPLLVPMNIEALVVAGQWASNAQWLNLKPDFRGVYRRDQVLGQQLEGPLVFSPSKALYKTGVHLHWALPDGLTHGIAAKDGGSPEFPALPNRWLVVRFWDQSGDNQKPDIKTRAWIVESDAVTNDSSAAVWPTLSSENLKRAEDYSVFVGRRFELSEWPGESGGARINLTAVGYGDPAFAAYYPACKGLLGFHDQDLADVKANAILSYMAVGWYSDLSRDPLQQALSAQSPGDSFAKLEELLGANKWVYPGFAEAQAQVNRAKSLDDELKEAGAMTARLQNPRPSADTAAAIAELQKKISSLEDEARALAAAITAIKNNLPTRTMCHGIITGIRFDDNLDAGVPRGKPFAISMGETAVEALAALFEKECGSDIGKLLAVFQYDLLNELEKPGGEAIVDYKVHERYYRPLARGIRWDLAQEKRPAFGNTPATRAPAIPGDVRALLERVNAQQSRINQLKRERDFFKGELYAAWYKKILNTQANKVSGDKLNQRMTECQQEIERLTNEIVASEDENEGRPKGTEWGRLQQTRECFLPDWKLQQLDEPQFWRPNDPVVLLAGDAFQRSPRHGEDGRYRADGRLLCRLGGQEINTLKITVPFAKKRDVEFGPAAVDAWSDAKAMSGGRPIPPVIVQLFREALFLTLEPNRARDIVTAAYEKNEPGLAASHGRDIQEISSRLIDTYLKKIWEVAENPDVENPNLRYPETDSADQTIWELIGRLPSPVAISQWKKNPWLPLLFQWQARWVPSYSDIAAALAGWELDGADFSRQRDDAGKESREQCVYRGTALLTPSATLQFSDRLRRYNLSHGDAKLRSLQTAVNSMNVLCQSLGGFTDQLMMRKSHLELRPLNPGNGNDGPQFSPIFDAVKDVDWLSPMMDGKFFPLRCGYLTLEKLWVVDAFGQILKLEEEAAPDGLKPVYPRRLGGANGAARLAPRLVQPARVSLQWLPAGRWDASIDQATQTDEDEESNPICGWIVPNFFDKGLMIYDARGYALGSLQASQRKSWREGVGAVREPVASFHWIDLPGSENFFFGLPPATITDPLGANANPHLRAYLEGLLSLTEGSGQTFTDLLESMSDALSAAGGAGGNPNLALLIGKPLALVRASIRLEVDGRIAPAQGWDDAAAMPAGGVDQIKFPLRLGDRRKWNGGWLGDDGLMGFFLARDYKKFYPAFGLEERLEGRNDDYHICGSLPQIAVGETLDLTLIMDPSRGVCVTSGILPRTKFHLPSSEIAEILENKEIIFFSGPILAPDTDKQISIPQPSDVYGQWSWTHHPEVKVWSEKSIADARKELGQFSQTALRISEGWLKLITAPLAVREFTVLGTNPIEAEKKLQTPGETTLPARFEVARGAKITLSWSVVGAEEIELTEEDAPLFKAQRYPLPARWAAEVRRDTSFTLIAAGRAAPSAAGAFPDRERQQKTIVITVKDGGNK